MKRLVSFITLICMLVGMLPAVALENYKDDSLPHIVDCQFNIASVFDSNGASPEAAIAVNKMGDYKATNWDFVIELNTAARTLGKNSVTFSKKADMERSALVFKVYVDKAMKYRPTMKYERALTRGYLSTYLFSEEVATSNGWQFTSKTRETDVAAVQNTVTPLGGSYIDAYSEESTSGTATFSDIELSSGTYYLVFVVDGANATALSNSSNKPNAGIYNFCLTEAVEIIEPPAEKVTISNATLEINGTKASVTGKLSNGEDITAENTNITYDSSDKTVATISQNGDISDVAQGTTTITATIEHNGDVVVREADYTVEEAPPVFDEFYPHINNYEFNSVSIYDTNGVPHGGDVLINTIENLGYSAKNWELVMELQTSSRALNTKLVRMGRKGDYELGALIFKIKVDASATYRPTLKYEKGHTRAYFNTYLISEEDAADNNWQFSLKTRLQDITEIHSELTPLGGDHIDAYHPETTTDVATFEDVTLAKGTYYLIFVVEDGREIAMTNANGTAIAGIYYFRLTEAAKFENAPEDKTTIRYLDFKINGKKAEISGWLSNGDAISSNNVNIKYESSDKSVAAVNETSGTVTDNSIGTTTITATVEYNGEVIVKKADYTVTEIPAEWSGEDVVYDFTSISSAWTGDKVIEAGFPDADILKNNDVRGITYFYSGNWEWRGVGKADGFNTWMPPANDVTIYTHKSLPAPVFYVIFRDKTLVNPYAAFNIKVPKAGRYSAAIEYAALKSVGNADFYIIPVPENNDDIYSMLTDEYYLGRVNSRDDTLSGTEYRFMRLNNITFKEAGEYVLVIKKGNIGNQVRFRKLYLDGINDIETIDVKISNDEIIYDKTENITVEATRLNGTPMNPDEYSVQYSTIYDDILRIKDGAVTGIGDGKETITVTVSDKTSSRSVDIPVVGNDMSGIVREECEIVFPDVLYVRGAEQLKWNIKLKSGNVVEFPFDVPVKYTLSRNDLASVDENGKVTANTDNIDGTLTIGMEAEFKGETISGSITFDVKLSEGKSAPTYYTEEMRENALHNVEKYSWAKAMQKEAVKAAEKYVENFEMYYDMMPEGEIPRSYYVGMQNDPFYWYCRWCGADNATLHGGGSKGGLSINPIGRPWKVQCPECKRLFPSNDFKLFYERCVEEYGYFDSKLARELNDYYVSIGEKDALKNDLYPDLTGVCQYGALREGETVEEWGVDDGWGYIPTKPDGSAYCAKQFDHTHTCKVSDPRDTSVTHDCVVENHSYIAYYMYAYFTEYVEILKALSKAYLYTGDEKYGQTGAILMDRLADVAPTYDLSLKQLNYPTGGGTTGMGHIIGTVPDASWSVEYLKALDAFYPCVDDAKVISFLEEKSENRWKGRTDDKGSALDVWHSWEKNLIEPMWGYVKSCRINGNYGMDEAVVALSALVLDKEPESSERIKWVWQKETNGYTNANCAGFLRIPGKWEGEHNFVNGGDLESKLIDVVDRDGFGNETAPSYNGMWLGRIYQIADAMNKFGVEEKYDLYKHPKFIQMHISFVPLIVSNYYSIQNGDIPGTASKNITLNEEALVDLFKITDSINASEEVKRDIKKQIVKGLLIYKNYDISNMNFGIFSADPERIQEEILELAETVVPVMDSEMLTGYGFAILRDGALYSTDKKDDSVNTQRSIYMTFGRNAGHSHRDALGIGMDAYGLNIAPDLGYATASGTIPERVQWTNATIAHNVVSVDREDQLQYADVNGYPRHFDDSGNVQLIDASVPQAYNQTDEYRRTVVMVKVDDSVSYGIDFFRVLGGSVHTYSFHSQAEKAYAVSGLDSMQKQVDENGNYIGSYAANFGAPIDYPVGKDPNSPDTYQYTTVYPRGYTWLHNVRRDTEPSQKFSVEFDVEDYRKAVTGGDDIVLRLTQLSKFTPDEVTIATGPVPKRGENVGFPRYLDWMIVQHEAEDGEKLDSLFTTVLEPYKEGKRYLKDMNPCAVEIVSGTPGETDKAYAVKVEHESGRVDYIVYATNNSVTYRVDNLFDFRGFVGVYTLNANGENTYRYVHDGNIIGDAEKPEDNSNFTGTVAGYSETLSFDNYIDVDFGELNLTDEGVNAAFAGKYVFIDNDRVENGVYKIVSAKNTPDGKVRLNTGLVSPIRAHIDPADPSKGYVFNVRLGQTATVYQSFVDASLPEFEPVGDNLSTSAGSSVKIDVNAHSTVESDSPKTITYIGTLLPRGASLNSQTGVMTWRPDSSQVGENHFAVTARDADGREATLRFTVTVYGSTTGNKDNADGDSTANTDSAGSGGGGGGGGGSAAPDTGDASDRTEDSVQSDNTEAAPDASGETDVIRFNDLSEHAWAADAITTLADDGIIKGTSETTFAPAANITRADFALLLVRAFKLTSDNTENFADVLASDYFASELAIARNSGIISGIGDNKYAPRNHITRQDMMVIVYRSLQKLDVGVGIYDEPQYEDFTTVAPYARDAVSALIGAGIVNGKSGRIAPLDYTTRAEVAVLIKRILEYAKE